MKKAFSTLKTHLANWRGWELNPVVVKELRQSVRSWAVTGMLLLFLSVLFCTALGLLVSQSFDIGVEQRIGARIFQVFVVVLTGASLTFIPLYVGIRLAAERQESNLDLLYITSLTPHRIIRGKFLCGAYMGVLFFSACMPFMVFTNLLRGVDLPTIFFILACLFLLVCAAVQAAIFLACLPVSRVFKILLALFGTLGVFSFILPLVTVFFDMMRVGIGSMLISGNNFWMGFSTSAGLIFAGVLLLYFVSVALISPASMNRALPLRSYLTLAWFLGAALSFLWMWKQRDARLVVPWAIITFIVMTGALVVNISNQDQLSFRVRRRIPVHPLKRAAAFLFFNGAAGGLIWVTLLIGATFAGTWLLLHQTAAWFPGFSKMDPDTLRDFEVSSGAVLLYAFAYALTALFLHRRFLSRRTPRLAGILAILLAGGWALAPNIVYFFLNRLTWKTIEQIQLGNVFNVFIVKNDDQKMLHLYFAAGWFLLMVILNAPWFVSQWRGFRRFQRADEPPVISETSAAPIAPAAVEFDPK